MTTETTSNLPADPVSDGAKREAADSVAAVEHIGESEGSAKSDPSPRKTFCVHFCRKQMFSITVRAEDADTAIGKAEDHWLGLDDVPGDDVIDMCGYGTDNFGNPWAEEVEP